MIFSFPQPYACLCFIYSTYASFHKKLKNGSNIIPQYTAQLLPRAIRSFNITVLYFNVVKLSA